MKNLVLIILILIASNLYSQNETIEKELFGKSFIFEKIYSYVGCSEESALSDKSVVKLKIEIDNNGKVTGGYGSVPCLESCSTYGEITGFAYSNLISVLWRSYESGSCFTRSLAMVKTNDAMIVVSQGIQVDSKIQDLKNPTEEKLLQVFPPPKISNPFEEKSLKQKSENYKEINTSSEYKFDGESQEKFEKSFEIILENTPVDEHEDLKEAVAMLLIFGTGSIDDAKEIKWERLRKEIDGMTRKEVLIYIEKRAKEDYE